MDEQKTNKFLDTIRAWLKNLVSQDDDGGSRQRLSRLAEKNGHAVNACDRQAHPVMTATMPASGRWNGQDDTDNYLLGHLLSRERQDHDHDVNRCAITHWKGIECLCPEELQAVEPHQASLIRPQILHRDGCISSYIDEVEPGMGFELDCLSCFLGGDDADPPTQKIESAKQVTDMRATVKDIPAIPPRLDFSPVDKNNRRNANA